LAEIEWLPAERLDVEEVGIPPISVPVPRKLLLSKKVTVPVAVPGETVAVNVTD